MEARVDAACGRLTKSFIISVYSINFTEDGGMSNRDNRVGRSASGGSIAFQYVQSQVARQMVGFDLALNTSPANGQSRHGQDGSPRAMQQRSNSGRTSR